MEALLNYPLSFEFKRISWGNKIYVTDAAGNSLAYVKKKLFKWKEHLDVYRDESETEVLYTIDANKWLDWSASYKFTDKNGRNIGRVSRKGMRSIWKAHYELHDENDQQDLLIQEENAWVKVWDAVLCEVPLLALFSGYFFNPAYLLKRPDGTTVCRFTKEKSMFGRKFKLTNVAAFESGEEQRVLLGIIMLLCLERRRG